MMRRKEGSNDVPDLAAYTLRIGEAVRFDINRFSRKGFPEIIFGQGKSATQIFEICSALNSAGQPAIISRIERTMATRLGKLLKEKFGSGVIVKQHYHGKVMVSLPAGWKPERDNVNFAAAIVTGGTSDVPVAHEVMAVLDALGYGHDEFLDCGIAGLHRSVEAAGAIQRGNYCVAIVFAGMEGALASVMASLLDIPVIGVPTSSGYGMGGQGTAALHAMLQSCIPGLMVMNIDNGIGAAAAAVSIMRQCRRGLK
jgi:hypothetical protein